MNEAERVFYDMIYEQYEQGDYNGLHTRQNLPVSLDIAVLLSIIQRLDVPVEIKVEPITLYGDNVMQVIRPVEDIAIDRLNQLFTSPPAHHDLLAGDV